MKTLLIRCVGLSPLLMDRMSEATLESLATGVRLQVSKDRPKAEVAAEKIYRDPNGRIALPAEMLFAALVGAGRNVKIGRKGISTAATTMLPDIMSIVESHLPLTNIPADVNGQEHAFWSADMRKGMGYNGKTPTAVAIIRPKFPSWEFEVTVKYDEKKAGEDTITALFTNAGSTQGLGSFRPNKKGMFGRFEVAEMVAVK
jgi:hypothetical protein